MPWIAKSHFFTLSLLHWRQPHRLSTCVPCPSPLTGLTQHLSFILLSECFLLVSLPLLSWALSLALSLQPSKFSALVGKTSGGVSDLRPTWPLRWFIFYVIKLPTLRTLLCGLARMIPLIHHTRSCIFTLVSSVRVHSQCVSGRLNNSHPDILPTFEAIVANIANADCSHTITTQQAALAVSDGYTLLFADPLDETKVCHHDF
jgi:hypothetical protein